MKENKILGWFIIFPSDFVSRIGIPVPVAMGLFINCYFLFEVQLLCLNLNVDVLTFEDSEWSRGRYKMECQVEKLEHFRRILLLEFNRGAKSVEAVNNICAVYEDKASERAW